MINPMAFWSDQNTLYSPSEGPSEADKKLDEWLQTPGASSDVGALSRLAYGAVTAAPRAIEGLATSAGNIGHWMGMTDEKSEAFLPTLPPGQTGGQRMADLASALMPVMAELPLMGAPVRGLASVTGLASAAPRLTRAAIGGAEFAGLAASSGDAATTAEQFGEGSLAGYIAAAMPRGIPRALASAGLGLLSKGFFDRNGGEKVFGDATQGDVAGLALGLSTAFVGKPVPKWTRPVVGEIPRLALPAPEVPTPIDVRPVRPGNMGPDGVIYADGPGQQMLQGGRSPQLMAPDNAVYALPEPASVPLLPEGNLSQFSNKPVDPIFDVLAPQTEQQLLNRTPGMIKPGLTGFRESPVVIPAGGPLYTPESMMSQADYQTQQIFNPANRDLIQQAAIGNVDPELLHQGQMTLQQLQTQWFAEDVLQANRKQTHNLVDWMGGVAEKPIVPEVLAASPIARLAKSPNILVEDLATELRSYSDAERIELGRAVGVDPNDTLSLARALKESYDASLRPRTPPQNPVTEADIDAMLYGPANPNLSPREQAVLRGMRKADPNRGFADLAMLTTGARGVVGAGAGYIAGEEQNMSEGDKWLAAAAMGGAALFGPALMRTLGRTGEAEAKIPQWGGKQAQRTTLTVEPPPRLDNNPRLAEIVDDEMRRAAAIGDVSALQRLQAEKTVKGKIPSLPEYMRSEGGGVGGVGGGKGGRLVTPEELFHVTSEENWNKISEQGFKPMQKSNWVQSGNNARYGKGEIYAFDNFDDAVRWAAKMDWNNNTTFGSGKYVIGKLKTTGEWVIDEADPLSASSRKGKAWKQMAHIPKEAITDVVKFDNKLASRMSEKEISWTGGMTKRQFPFNLGGFSQYEMSQAMGRASAGALIGSLGGALVDDPGSHTGLVAGAIGGALLSMAGPALIRRALAEHANAQVPQTHATPDVAKTINTTVGVRKMTFPELIAKAKLVIDQPTVLGQAPTIVDRTLARLDNWFGLSQGPTFSRLLGQSYGPATFHTRNIDDAFHKISFIQADKGMIDLTNQFLNGSLSREEYLKQMAVDSNHKAYADFATVARDSADGLIEIASRGQGNSKRTEMMKDSMGKYLTRSHRLYIDPSYSPSVEATNKLAQKIYESKAWDDPTDTTKTVSLDQIKSGLNQYVKEIQQEKGVYRSESGKKIEQNVFSHRKELQDEWKQFLGEVSDPQDRIRLTVLKLKPMAEASNFMHMVSNGLTKSDEGLKFAFSSSGEKEAAQQAVLQSLQKDPGNPLLRKQLLELQQYQYVKSDARYGALQGQYVHRNVYDVLNDWDQSMKVDSAWMRSLMGMNQMMKANVTYRNPMATLRQALTSPFFLQIGRGFGGMEEAWNIVRNPDHPMHKELMDNGISNVDSITKDVLRDVDRLHHGMLAIDGADAAKAFLGRADQSIAKAGAIGKFLDSKMAEYFKMPDNFVRISTYLAAKTRFANELGAALDSPEVINKAVEFTNRYTMNYNLLPKAVVKGRNVPFVNMFISYTAEMGRILKNLGEDVIKGDGAVRMNAVMALGTMVAIPEMLQRTSEASLSPKDREEWERVKAGMPEYAKDRYYIVSKDKTTGKFRTYDFSNLLPADQFQQTIRSLADGRVLDAAQNNPFGGWDKNPAMNIGAMLITGRDRISQRKLRGPTDYAAAGAKEIGGPFFPGVGTQWEHFRQAYSTNADGTQGITDKRGRTLSATDFWLPYVTAIKAGTIDPKVIERSVIADYKSRVANEFAYLNDIRRTNEPKEIKDRAAARTQQALQQLQDDLNRKLGITPTTNASLPQAGR